MDRIVDIEFHEVVAKVEERWRPELDDEARKRLIGTEDVPGKYEPKMVSTGWWIVLARFGVAICTGKFKPDIAPGDTLVAEFRKVPKPPEAGTPAPAPLPAPDLRGQLKALRDKAPAEAAEAIDAAIAALGPELVT